MAQSVTIRAGQVMTQVWVMEGESMAQFADRVGAEHKITNRRSEQLAPQAPRPSRRMMYGTEEGY